MYTVVVEKSAQKKLYKLHTDIQKKIASKLKLLESNPRPEGSKKLTGRPGYRIRTGDYRIIYLIHDNVLTVLVIDIDHRNQVYK